MNAKDLMIGDWVIFDGEPTQVQEVLVDTVTICCWPKDYEDISPIPLTSEILVKNGFDDNTIYKGAYVFADDYEHELLVYLKETNETNGSYTYIDAHCGCLDISEMPINYVHELQHIIMLCHVELEIVL